MCSCPLPSLPFGRSYGLRKYSLARNIIGNGKAVQRQFHSYSGTRTRCGSAKSSRTATWLSLDSTRLACRQDPQRELHFPKTNSMLDRVVSRSSAHHYWFTRLASFPLLYLAGSWYVEAFVGNLPSIIIWNQPKVSLLTLFLFDKAKVSENKVCPSQSSNDPGLPRHEAHRNEAQDFDCAAKLKITIFSLYNQHQGNTGDVESDFVVKRHDT
jgi:hypothetical protein